MNRFPHKIAILKPTSGDNPYVETDYTYVYQGRGRCFLNRQSAFRTNKVMDCDYQVVIPDRSMVEVGETYKICVKFQNTPNSSDWDLIGFIKDFARYDRVCNIYFQMVKENIISEDIP